jgi:hypothetical protein
MKAFLICACAFAPQLFAQTLPGTTLLEPNPDFSAAMVAGVDQFLLRKTAEAKAARAAQWPGDAAKHRERLRAIIGAVDARLSVRELVGSLERDALLYDGKLARVQRGRWSVFDRVHRERLLPLPKENA